MITTVQMTSIQFDVCFYLLNIQMNIISLQHEECAGQKLLIKFPDNPIVNGNVVIRKNNPVVPNKK